MIKKIVSAVLAAVILCSTALPCNAAFSDISDTKTATAASVLQSMEIAGGVGNGNYSPNTVLTRAQFCAFAVRAMGLEESVPSASYKTLFSDVKPGNWFVGYVNLAYDKGIVKGYGNGKFGPNDPINYAQVLTILVRLLGYTTDDIGKVWPTDDINFAKEKGISDGVSANATSQITRGQAAILLCNMLETEPKGSNKPYYESINGVASIRRAIVLDIDADNAHAENQLMVCSVGNEKTVIEYFDQEREVPADFVGEIGDVLLDSSDKVIGFIPSADETEDVVIKSAKAYGITDTSDTAHRITGSAVTIIGEELYTWNDTGYIQADDNAGKTARLYYNDDGTVAYVYLASGTTGVGTDVIVADTNTPTSEFARRLSLSGSYSITKNGASAQPDDLAKHDVAYYNVATDTLCVSDYKVTGVIEAAYPSVDAAETITIGGCELPVIEAAWDSLSNYKLGDKVTLLLTDDCKVAAATNKTTSDMIGVLDTDGRTVTLCDSGLVLVSNTIDADSSLYGMLVKVRASKGELYCTAYTDSGKSGKLSIKNKTLGNYSLAPECKIYEQASAGGYSGYVYSLSGEIGKASTNFDDIYWTGTISASNITNYHINSAGKVDLILLNNVTGNSYEYGEINIYEESMHVDGTIKKCATITNDSGVSERYLSVKQPNPTTYAGIALRRYNSNFHEIAAACSLTKAASLKEGDFFLYDEEWRVNIKSHEIPVSEKVKVYFESTKQWMSGENGVKVAIASGLTLDAYYDRTVSTGAQVRVLVVKKK